MEKSVRKLRPEGNPLDPANYGISLDHAYAVQWVIDCDDRVLSRTQSALAFDRAFDRRNRLAVVRDAAFDAASGASFKPDRHDVMLDHARAVAEAMTDEADLIRSGLRRGRIQPAETFELLFEVHEFVCSMIENAMEGCL